MADPIQTLARFLAERDGLKLWSLIVTIMGDRALSGQSEMSGTHLAALIERIGLNPQAMRVALHRLKRDGWIESRREGRVSFHALTAKGLKETRAVSERVYGPAPVPLDRVRLCVTAPEAPAPSSHAIVLAADTFLADDSQDAEALCAEVAISDLPDWARAIIETKARAEDMRAHAELLEALSIPSGLNDHTALRFLALHAWRRLILRADPLACRLLGDDNAVQRCRASAWRLIESEQAELLKV